MRAGTLFVFTLFFLFILTFQASAYTTEELKPSANVLWPKPNEAEFGDRNLRVFPDEFRIHVKSRNEIIEKAIQRYFPLMFPFPFTHENTGSELGEELDRSSTWLSTLYITIQTNTSTIQTQTKEMFELQILEAAELSTHLNPQVNEYVAFLYAETPFGAIRGLDTFSQLVQEIKQKVEKREKWQYFITSAPLTIHDHPRFYWRGLMIDTARHIATEHELKSILDTMEWCKLNIFHWHITDAASFPFLSENVPELANGAFAPSAVFNHSAVERIISYANDRGIEVIPEFNVPSHVASWGKGIPSLVAPCSDNILDDQLDIGREETYTILQSLLNEITSLFPDRYLHLGGNDVDIDCWKKNITAEQVEFWTARNISAENSAAISSFFFEQLFQMAFLDHKHIIVWEDLMSKTSLPTNAIVQVVSSGGSSYENSLSGGYRTILSSNYFLAEIEGKGSNWEVIYQSNRNEFKIANKEENAELAVGGESCLWADLVQPEHREPFIWPFASVVAEKLWAEDSSSLTGVAARLDHWICRIRKRGKHSAAIQPGSCPLPPSYSFPVSVISELNEGIQFGYIAPQRGEEEEEMASASLEEESEVIVVVSGSIFPFLVVIGTGFTVGCIFVRLWDHVEGKAKMIVFVSLILFFTLSFVYSGALFTASE